MVLLNYPKLYLPYSNKTITAKEFKEAYVGCGSKITNSIYGWWDKTK